MLIVYYNYSYVCNQKDMVRKTVYFNTDNIQHMKLKHVPPKT